jgi:hypothetical protein
LIPFWLGIMTIAILIMVAAIIRLFDPAYNVRRIAARRRYKGNGIFKRGTILRHALDCPRMAQGPLTAREILAPFDPL